MTEQHFLLKGQLAIATVLNHVLSVTQSNGGIRLLLIDNVAAFYWLDRACKPSTPAAGQNRHSM